MVCCRHLPPKSTRRSADDTLQATPLRLLDLNEDVLRLVLEQLSPVSLSTVARVHPYIRYLAQQILFSNIRIRLEDDSIYRAYDTQPPIPTNPVLLTIPSLVATIVQRPDLAGCVRKLSVGGSCWSTRYEGDSAPKLVAHETDLQATVSFVLRQTGLSYRHDWAEALRGGSPDAYLAVLISQLPRLRRLKLTRWFFEASEWLGCIARSVLHDAGSLGAGMPARFEDLEDIQLTRHPVSYLTWPPDDSKRNTANALAFLQAPSLINAEVVFDHPDGPDLVWPANQLPPSPWLTSLCVTGIREGHLVQLLAALPTLRSLQWNFDLSLTPGAEYNSPLIDLELILGALARSRHTLSHLELNIRCLNFDHAAPPQLRLRGTLEELATFDQLTSLTVPVLLLTGFELPRTAGQPGIGRCLPQNLEKLVLTDGLAMGPQSSHLWPDESQALREVTVWLGEARSLTPRLRKLRLFVVDYYGDPPDRIQDARDAVQRRAEEVGLKTDVHFSSPW